jgi:hypothetical protein
MTRQAITSVNREAAAAPTFKKADAEFRALVNGLISLRGGSA